MKRFLAVSAIAGLACVVPASDAAPSAEARVSFTEVCRYRPLSDSGIALTTDFTLRSIGELPAVATVTPGWNVGRVYPKGLGSRTLRLRPGQTVTFSVTRRLPHAPALRAALKPPARLHCESKIVIRVAKR